jgi:5,10-methylenetetrahydromethanopterin reductase
MTTHSGDALLAKHFSIYVLPGRTSTPARAIAEARAAAEAGLGGVWISERYASKEPAVIAGALAFASPTLRIGGTFYAHMRHPIVTASVANLMQSLTAERFVLVLARAIPAFFAGFDVPTLTFERLADTISIMRRLWSGEPVNYQGIVGHFDNLTLTDRYEGNPPPIVFTAVGPKALAFSGQHCDGVLLHPLLTPEAVGRSASAARAAAVAAGKAPTSIRVIANVIVAPDLPPDEEEAVVGGRAVTYLQSKTLGPLLAATNGWDPKVLDRLRAHPTIARHSSGIVSQVMLRPQLVEASRVLPAEWLQQGTAAGTSTRVAARLCEYLAAGADEILLHGSTGDQMKSLTLALKEILPRHFASARSAS